MNAHYQALPDKVKKLLRPEADGSGLSLHTKKGVMIKLGGAFLLFLCVQSLVLSVVLEGHEGAFYGVLTLISAFTGFYLFGQSHRLVFDRMTNRVFLQRSAWWRAEQMIDAHHAETVEILLTRGESNQRLQVSLLNQLYVFDQPSDAHALMDYLQQQFRVVALEQISDWPNKHPWRAEGAAPHAIKPVPEKTSAKVEPPLYKSSLVVPIWSRGALLKLALPIPVFSVLAALIESGVLL
ncbi:hypothetical protein [Neptunomonas concharum]|uniref:Uncharacterized protein n=1 Tax=Neptunomonas concharum TaxID=1031538 RepID=A0A5P1RDJ4_9GAMM|nr:hypothetical protein [Neptunomonas concharum]QEQ97719.1 hypothetical protein F0U83_13865 [Neptunomonas concharum]